MGWVVEGTFEGTLVFEEAEVNSRADELNLREDEDEDEFDDGVTTFTMLGGDILRSDDGWRLSLSVVLGVIGLVTVAPSTLTD